MSLPVEKRRQWIKSRREQRKQTRYARLRRQFLRYSILFSLLILGGLVLYKMKCRLYENSRGLEIKGNMVASNEQISSALKSEVVNSPLFVLDPNELENRVKNLSIIKHAFVRRYLLPHPRLKVEVLEEFPWATLYCPSPNLQAKFVVAESGRLISLADFPNVYKPALKIYAEDPRRFHLTEADVEQWANWTNYISKQTQCPVVAIDMLEPHNIKVETSKFSLVLGNPDSGLPCRLYRLAAVLEVLASQHKEPIYVNLSLNSNIPVKLAKKSDKLAEEKITQL